MHVAFIVENIPNPATGGGALTAWMLIQVLLQGGHRVTAYLILPSSIENHSEGKSRLAALANLGVETIPLTLTTPLGSGNGLQGRWHRRFTTLYRGLHPSLSDYYPWVSMAPQMASIVRKVRPDVIFTYHWQATAATYGLHHAPRMAAIGDPDYLVYRYRSKLNHYKEEQGALNGTLRHRLFSIMKTAVDRGNHSNLMRRLLLDCDRVGFFAAHHAASVRKNGVDHCLYLRTPVPDSVGPEWETARAQYEPHPLPRILLIGHVQGTATLSGLYLFARETLPVLEDELGVDSFEIHIVGGGSLPPDLSQSLARPSVRLRGHIEPADGEFLSSDILLVPTPFELGIRVRILVGWSFGCCVVAHRANALGIPEMIHEENALLASDGRSLANAVIRALRDTTLRRKLGSVGRKTYEKFFTPSTAGERILAEVEKIAQQGVVT